jgi:hypothetical protein
MAQAGLLLPKAPRRRQSSRTHEGKVAVGHSDLRWCSDGLEIKCDSGQTRGCPVNRCETTTFAVEPAGLLRPRSDRLASLGGQGAAR